MTSRIKSLSIRCFCVAWVLICIAALGKCEAQETEVWIATKTGEMIQGTTVQQSVPWNNVTEKGEITQSKIPIDAQNGQGVKRLILTGQPASAAIAKVRQLVRLLTSDSYTQRHQAEVELIKMGGAYQDIIRSVELPDEPETQIRFQRIKDTLSMRTTENVKTEFDFCWTNDGKKLSGDVGNWELTANVRGQELICNRNTIDAIYFSNPINTTKPDAQKFDSHAYYYDPEGFRKENQLLVTFETDSSGFNIPNNTDADVTNSFRHLGCIFECEGDPGNHVIVSNFSMKGSVSKKNTACNYRPALATKTKFYGVMRISFVDPEFPNIPATVNELGLFMAVVSPRQSVIEAYNVDGYRIGTVESTKINSFVGIHSREPIAYVRVMANQDYIVPDNINADENFAIDDVFVSTPVPSDQVGNSERYSVVLRDGQRWSCQSIEYADDNVILRDTVSFGPKVELSRDEIQSIIFPKSLDPPVAGKNKMMGMLNDGSVVFVQPGTQFKLANFDQTEIEPGQLLGYWGGEQTVRYPESSDFEKGKLVVALPNVRAIAPTYNLLEDRCEIDFETIDTIVPPAELEQLRVPGDTDAVKDLQYANSPCIWFAEPVVIGGDTGLVRLKDGRRFVLNSQFGFDVSELTDQGIVMTRAGKKITIPMENVRTIRFSK